MNLVDQRSVEGARTLGSVVLLAVCWVACATHKDAARAEDAGAPIAPSVAATPALAPPALATNEEDIARFPEEQLLERIAATIERPTKLREAPSVGRIVTSLTRGTAITQIARMESAFLIVVDGDKRLMGWVGSEAFTPAPVTSAASAKAKPLTCSAPEVALMGDTPFCGRTCKNDSDCSTGRLCKGTAAKLTGTKVGAEVSVCINAPPPRRTATAEGRDAGLAPGPGPGPVPVAIVDAGRPPLPGPSSAADPTPPPTPAPPSTAPSSPASDLPDCVDRGAKVRPGTTPPPPVPCLANKDRPNGTRCKEYFQCSSRNCAPNNVCAACKTDQDCPNFADGRVCKAGKCFEKQLECLPTRRFCWTNNDCCSGSCKEEVVVRGRTTVTERTCR